MMKFLKKKTIGIKAGKYLGISTMYTLDLIQT